MAAYLAAPTLNPLEWSSWPFVLLITVTLLLLVLVPWPPTTWARVAREALIIIPAVFLYFLVRGLVGSEMEVAVRHGQQIIDLERSLGIFVEQDLQRAIIGSEWRIDLLNWIYIWAHWPVIAIVFAYLILRRHDRYPIYRNAILISGVIGMIIFALYPVAPPRLMPGYEFFDTVTQRSSSYRVLQPPALANPYAAMPSLHFGWDLLVGIALFREASWLLVRIIGVILPVGMFLAVVLTANHYILDAVAGGIIVLVCLAFTDALDSGKVKLPNVASRLRERLSRGREVPPAIPERKAGTVHRDGNRKGTSPLTLSGPYDGHGANEGPLVIAHRFGNSIATLREAELAGVDVIEADVWLHRDQLEVRHSKTLGPVPVLWDRWSLEAGWKPRLQIEELLQAAGPDTMFMLDFKGRNPDIARRAIEALERHVPGRQVLVTGQNWSQLQAFLDYEYATVVHSIGNGWQLRRSWDRLYGDEHIAVSIQFRLLNARVVNELKQRVPTVITWPVNSPDRLELVLAWGVDGFTSDNLELMARFIRNRSSTTALGIGSQSVAGTIKESGPG